MEEYEKATVEVVEMGTAAVIAESTKNYQSAPAMGRNGNPDDSDMGFDVIP